MPSRAGSHSSGHGRLAGQVSGGGGEGGAQRAGGFLSMRSCTPTRCLRRYSRGGDQAAKEGPAAQR
eukprot:scaffold133846_cov105-Phaeocystis_antarctica.AAC.1